MKILITGGHLTPALATMHALPSTDTLLYVGRKYALEGDRAYSLEYSTCTALHIPFVSLTTGKLQRFISWHMLSLFWKLPVGFIHSLIILFRFKPDVIMTFGGYISLPIGLMGWLLGIPLIIHEQTLEAGLANRILSIGAKTVCISWESSRTFFPKNKTILTGNPLLESVGFNKKERNIRKEKTLLIVGGSLGSHAINMLIKDCLPNLVKTYTVIHQTGDAREYKDYEQLKKMRSLLPLPLQKRYVLYKFIAPNDIVSYYRQSDLIISRAGINTVTYLLALQKMVLYIPLPFAQRDEQTKNALMAKEHGLAQVYPQQELTSEKLCAYINEMITEKNHKKVKDVAMDIHIKAAGKIAGIISRYAS